MLLPEVKNSIMSLNNKFENIPNPENLQYYLLQNTTLNYDKIENGE